MADSAKVILKKKEVRSNTGLAPDPLALFEKDASLPLLSPLEKEPEPENCRAIRRDIVRSRPEIDLAMISYMRLSLLTVRASDTDGHQPTRWAVNMDCSFDNNTAFQKFKWRDAISRHRRDDRERHPHQTATGALIAGQGS